MRRLFHCLRKFPPYVFLIRRPLFCRKHKTPASHFIPAFWFVICVCTFATWEPIVSVFFANATTLEQMDIHTGVVEDIKYNGGGPARMYLRLDNGEIKKFHLHGAKRREPYLLNHRVRVWSEYQYGDTCFCDYVEQLQRVSDGWVLRDKPSRFAIGGVWLINNPTQNKLKKQLENRSSIKELKILVSIIGIALFWLVWLHRYAAVVKSVRKNFRKQRKKLRRERLKQQQ